MYTLEEIDIQNCHRFGQIHIIRSPRLSSDFISGKGRMFERVNL